MSKFRLNLDTALNGQSLNLSGRRIEITDASSADALVSLSAIYPGGVTRDYYDFKKFVEAFSAELFSDLRVRSAAQPGEWVEIEVTQHEEEWVYKSRQDIVIDSIANPITVDDANLIAAVQDVELSADEISILLQNDRLKRNSLTTLQGATLVSVINATTTVVTGAANVNGVIIRSINLFSGSNVTAYLQIGSVKLLQTAYSAGAAVNCDRENIFVPAGNQIIISGGNTSSGGNMAYEVL